MDYIELECKISAQNSQEIIEILIAELNEVGFESYAESEDKLTAYIVEKNFDFAKIKQLQVNHIQEIRIEYSHKLIKAQDWNAVWEKNFDPILLGDQCFVRAPFHNSKPDIKFEIIIEPKMSFGTGHHETTYLMLKTILELNCENKTVLDMGCGTGILSILASHKGAKEITAIDIDEWAYHNTIENIERNNCAHIKVLQGDASLLTNQQFDLIIANINRNILLEDIKHYAKVLKSGGTLLLSGIYEQDLPMILEETSNQRIKYVSHKDKNNWIAAKFFKE